jgi:hypothetical protein
MEANALATRYLIKGVQTSGLEVSAGHRIVVTPGTEGPYPEYLMIRIVNIGHREAQITNIGWKVGLFRRLSRYAVQPFEFDHGRISNVASSKIPVRLKDGEEANYFVSLNEQINWLQDFSKKFLRPFPRIKSRFVKVQVFTSIGKTFEAKIEKPLRKKLIEVEKHCRNGRVAA